MRATALDKRQDVVQVAGSEEINVGRPTNKRNVYFGQEMVAMRAQSVLPVMDHLASIGLPPRCRGHVGEVIDARSTLEWNH